MAVTHQHILLLALLLASPTVARAAQAAEGTATVPRFEPAPCPKLQGAETLAKASCGYLVVPENRSRPNGRTIRLMVAKYPARSPEKRPDPVVYLAGGPGDIAPLEVNGFIAADFIRDRDIYVVSQRGTMFSEPALTCAASDDFARELLGLRFYSEATKRAHLAATEACHRELAATGADLSAYNSTESAADFADLRKVLGFDSVECLRDFLRLLPGADAHARPPGRHPQRRPRFGLADDLHRRRKLAERARRLRQHLPGLRGGTGLQRRPSPSRRNLHRTGQQARGRAADDNRQRPGHRQRHRSRHRRRGADRLAAQPELWRAHAPSRAGSHRWARCRPPRRHRGDRPGSGKPGAAARSGCPCPRLWAGPWRQLSRKLSVRDAGGSRRGRPEGVSGLSGLGDNARVSAAGRISTKTAATSGRSPPPRRPCTSPSRAASRRSSSPAASIR